MPERSSWESGERQTEDDRDWGIYELAVRRWESVLGQRAPDPVDDAGRLNVDFVAWMMAAPPGWCDCVSRTAALKGLGNGVVVTVAEVAGLWALAGLDA